MEALLQTYRIKLDLTPVNCVRSFHDTINWKNRLIGILGQKGVGTSTMIFMILLWHSSSEAARNCILTKYTNMQDGQRRSR